MRILHGPVNIVGIGAKCSAYQRARGYISDFIVYEENRFFRDADVNLDLPRYRGVRKKLLKLAFFLFAILRYDVFHFYFGESLFKKNRDLPILKLFRKKILMTYCGSEARLIYIEKRRNPFHHHLQYGLNHPRNDQKKLKRMRWQSRWVHKAFAPRNLYASVREVYPESKILKDIWIHNMIDTREGFSPSGSSNAPPIIVHAPTQPEIKGTRFLEDALNRIRDRGYTFEYIRLEGVPHEEAIEMYRNRADIIVDQLLLGAFGTLAVEGMYYGKPVCCYLLEEVRQELYPDCPIVNCSVDTLEEKLVWLLENPDQRRRIGQEGHEYVKRHFDWVRINEGILQLYATL